MRYVLVITNGLAAHPDPPLLVWEEVMLKLSQYWLTVTTPVFAGGTFVTQANVPPFDGGQVTTRVQQPCTVTVSKAIQPLASVTMTV